MNPERRREIWVGAFTLAGVIAIAFLAIRIGGGRFSTAGMYSLKARFSNVGGLHEGAAVEIAGVRVGVVHSVALDEKELLAVVELRLNQSVKLDRDTIASIRTRGLIGDKYLALSPGGSEETLRPGDTIAETEPAVDIEGLIGKMAFGDIDKTKDNPKGP